MLPGVLTSDKRQITNSNQEWPTQARLYNKSGKVWAHTITSLHCIKIQSNILCRDKKLGHWLNNPTIRTRVYPFHYSASLDEIFETASNGYTQKFSTKIGPRLYKVNHASAQHTNQLFEDCISVSKTHNNFHVHLSHSKPSVKQRLPQKFDEYISQQPTWIQELIQHYQ